MKDSKHMKDSYYYSMTIEDRCMYHCQMFELYLHAYNQESLNLGKSVSKQKLHRQILDSTAKNTSSEYWNKSGTK